MTLPEDVDHAPESEEWRGILTGTAPYIAKWRSRYSTLPSPPRCKVCAAPFAGPGRFITRLTGHHVIPGNPLLCNRCLDSLAKHPGGAEVDVSVLFADIRGSTGLAEKVGAAHFRQLLQSYYAKASAAIEASDGVVDKLLGDGVMALFIPVIAGENHRLRAIEAGRRVIRAVEESDLPRRGVRVGAGVQSGTTFVGVLGSGDKLDFSALGDVVNTAARLGGMAGPGELLVSADAWRAAGLSLAGVEVRWSQIAGRVEDLETVALSGATLSATIQS
jgi:adenylate cyclase